MIGLGIKGRLLIAGVTVFVVAAAFGLAAIVETVPAPWSWLIVAVGVWLMAEGVVRAVIWGADRW